MNEATTTREETMPKVRPATDIVEKEDGFHIFIDMPGVRKEGLTIDLNADEVTVSGRTAYPADPTEAKDRHYSHVEFGGGEYVRTFTLSDTVDKEKITAKLDNGVLNLHLPKSEKAVPKKIEISVE